MAEPHGTPGGPLYVRRPGAVEVQTDAMLWVREQYAGYADALRHAITRVDMARDAGRRAGLDSAPALACDDYLVATRVQLERAMALADRLHDGLLAAARLYAHVDGEAERLQRFGSGLIAAGLGLTLMPLLVLFLFSPLFPASLIWARLAPQLPSAPGGGETGTDIGAVLRAHPELVTSPEFVELVRLMVSSADDVALGAAGVQGPVASFVGDDGLGLTGVAFATGATLATARLYGTLYETPVRVDRVAVRHEVGSAPQGSVDRLIRVPDGANQIRIERYTVSGEAPRWTVYVSPTVTFEASGPEPFDLRSNLEAVAGGSPASLRAVEAAMRDAGVAPGDEVQFVGYSQGGIVAACAVESGEWNAVGIETYGAPVGNVDLAPGMAGMTVRHTDDLVPALAGPELDHDVLRLERRAFAPGDDIPHVDVPAHHKEQYLRTAELIDGAESRAVRQQVAAMDAFGSDYLRRGGAMSVFTYHAERVE